jgi:hypothetical protein
LAEDSSRAEALQKWASAGTEALSQPKKGGILAALQRSPLVGLDIEFDRSSLKDRTVDL